MIRAAIEDDMPRILEIEREAISPPWTHGGLLREICGIDSFFALMVEDSLIIGFVILRRMADEGELLQIAVDRAHRRRGAADYLMASALDWAGGCGVNSLYLEVRNSNEPAIALYEKHGFMQVGVRNGYYTAPIEDALIMARRSSSRLEI